jgi:flagellar L-ring protein precursor FlgH
MRNLIIYLCAALAISGCSRLERVGQAPGFSPLEAGAHDEGVIRRVSVPMPPQKPREHKFSSLWTPGEKDFFVDVRAKSIGDIVTVLINIDDKAKMNNTSERSRQSSEDASIGSFFGLEGIAKEKIKELELDPAVKAGSKSLSKGSGDINRNEQIELKIAAVVTDILPNGNLAIAGRQEVLVNYEMRDLRVVGIIRPIDINAQNEIEYKDIAEARIAYGGRGVISDVQQPRYGQQVYDILMPW